MVKTIDEAKYPQCKQARSVWVTLSILLASKLTAPLLQSSIRPHWGQGVVTLLQQRMSRLSVYFAIVFKKIFTSTGVKLWRKSSILCLRYNSVRKMLGVTPNLTEIFRLSRGPRLHQSSNFLLQAIRAISLGGPPGLPVPGCGGPWSGQRPGPPADTRGKPIFPLIVANLLEVVKEPSHGKARGMET